MLVTERWASRKFMKGGGGCRALRIFDVTDVSNLDEAIDAVEAHDSSTAHNAQFPLNSLLYCDNRDGEEVGFRFWTVSVSYATSPDGRFFDHLNPLDEPTKWRVVFGSEQIASPVDALGKEVFNTAGQAFSTDPPGFVKFIMLIGQRTEPFYDLEKAVRFNNAINSQDMTLDNAWQVRKGQACCRYHSLLSTVSGAEPYVITETAIEIRRGFNSNPDSDGYFDGFKARLLNTGTQGFYPNVGGTDYISGPLVEVLTDPTTKQKTFQKVSYPVLLDAQGRPTGENIYVACPPEIDANGYTTPVGNNHPNYAGIIEDTDYATFIKIFPSGYTFENLLDLGL